MIAHNQQLLLCYLFCRLSSFARGSLEAVAVLGDQTAMAPVPFDCRKALF